MTTAQPMLCSWISRALVLAATLALFALAGAPGCGAGKPVMPSSNSSPYGGEGDVIWAVAPLRNESGVSTFDELALTDTLTNEVQQVAGVSVVPVNRTLAAMRALGLPAVRTASDALAICRTLGVDAIVVGVVTAYDPYDPPTLGMNLALYAMSETMHVGKPPEIDPAALRGSPTDPNAGIVGSAAKEPLSVIAEVLDASDGATRERIRQYAAGRHDPSSALGWRRYTASMGLYAKFACFEMTGRLLASERARLARIEARAQSAPN